MTAHSAEPQLEIVRRFAAPRELVWEAWTDPEQVRAWSGPQGFAVTLFESAGVVGGPWRLVMRSDQWGEHAQHGILREIDPPSRLVYSFAWESEDGSPEHEMVVTVDLAEVDGGTEMTFRQGIFPSDENRDSHLGGWSECFDKLAEHLGAGSA